MSGEETKATGGCLCGAVRYEAVGQPLSVIHCHCLSCRRHTGAPVVTLAGYKEDQVRFTAGERRLYESSPGIQRAFCGQCGTPLTWEGEGASDVPLVEIHVSTLDNPDAFVPELHLHHDERIAWFETVDALPRYHAWDRDNEPYRHGPAGKGPGS